MRSFMNKVPAALVVCCTILSLPMHGQDDLPASADHEKAMTAIQFMNYLRYVSYEIADYNNVFVLEDEYRNLSPDNLNLGRIPDDQVALSITEHLQTLYELRMEEKDRERFHDAQTKLAQRHRQDMLLNFLKSATTVAGKESAMLAAVFAGATSGRIDADAITKLSSAMAGESFSVYENYVNYQRQLEDAAEEYQHKFDDRKMARLHEDNMKNFDFTRALIRRYGIEDKLRLTEADAKTLISCVKSEDKSGAFNQLKVMANHQPSFRHFPAFWCYYASFASLSGHHEEALEAANHFENISQYSLFRRDRLAAQTAMAKIQSMIAKGMISGDNAAQIKKALLTIVRYNYDSHEYDMAYFSAAVAHAVIGDDEFALDVLNGLIAEQERKSSRELARYGDLFTKPKKRQPFESVPMMSDLIRCHALRATIEKGEEDDTLKASLAAFFGNTIAQGVERLFWVGDIRGRDLFAKAKPEIDAMQLEYASGMTGVKADSLVAKIPVSWFVLGDFPLALVLKKGTNVVETITDGFDRRKIVFTQPQSKKAFVEIVFARNSKWTTAKEFDGCELRLPHSSWPISIFWQLKPDRKSFGMTSVMLFGVQYSMQEYEKTKKDTLDVLSADAEKRTKGENDFSVAVPYPEDCLEIATNGLACLKCKDGHLMALLQSKDVFEGRIAVRMKCYNGFGLFLGESKTMMKVDTEKDFDLTINWPKDLQNAGHPDFILLSFSRTPRTKMGKIGNGGKKEMDNNGEKDNDHE